jgi:hypothetical protein
MMMMMMMISEKFDNNNRRTFNNLSPVPVDICSTITIVPQKLKWIYNNFQKLTVIQSEAVVK